MKKVTYIILATAFAAASCQREPVVPSTGSGDEIRFDAAGYVHATKADGSTALDTVVHFGASATLNTGGYSYTYFENAEIAYNKTEGLWKGVQKLAWPRQLASYTMDFQCYAPYSATPWCTVNEAGDNLMTSSPVTAFSISPTDPNYDLLYSDRITGQTKSATGVPVLMHHALASVGIGVNIVRSNDAVVLDAGGRYTYVEWVPGDPLYESTKVSYIVPIGDHPNDLEGIPAEDTDDDKILNTDGELRHGSIYHQPQKYGYRLKNSIQNVWIASLIECRFENIAETGSVSMKLNEDEVHWDLPENGVWTIPSSGPEGVDAHSSEIVFFEGQDIEIPPSMRSTTHIFPFELHVIPQDLNWSPLTPSNNQVMQIKMKVRQFNYKQHAANDKNDLFDGVSTGDPLTFDYRDIYKYAVWEEDGDGHTKGEFKSWETQESVLAPGVQYVNMVWRDGLTPTYEYVVEKSLPLYDENMFVSTPPKYWKMNTKTVYVTRINFAGHLMEFFPDVIEFTSSEVEGGGYN